VIFALDFLLAAGVGYLVGAIPFGYFVAKAHGVNILKEGSGNPGATNVKRVVGKRAGNTVFALDFLKGILATAWVLVLPIEGDQRLLVAEIIGLCAAILGHSFSIFLKGKGGKGVATTMGGLMVIMPWVVLIGVVIWVVTFYASRYVSLASILFAASLPVGNFLLGAEPLLVWISLALALLIIFRHRSNIQRLLNGTENRFARRKEGK
jgi:acyl phosphate:glycerol-3-phosphate acyltransferase